MHKNGTLFLIYWLILSPFSSEKYVIDTQQYWIYECVQSNGMLQSGATMDHAWNKSKQILDGFKSLHLYEL